MRFLTIVVCILVAGSDCGAQSSKSTVSLLVGNAPWDFKIGWYEIDNESYDDHDVRQIAFSTALKYQRVIREDVSFRMRGSLSFIDLYEHRKTAKIEDGAHSRQFKYQLAPGIAFSINHKSFSLYGGLEFPAYFHGRVKTDFTDLFNNPPLYVDESYSSTIPAGFMAGLAPLTGFTFNLSDRFFWESEFSILCMYGSVGGKTSSTTPDMRPTQDRLAGTFFEPRVSIGAGFRF